MRSDGGRVLRRGRIRVDARKAMAKLREHLLVDLHLYAVEVARAAVLAGATRVDVSYDADDVVITFDGAPLEAGALPRLFEHLTGDEGGAAQHLRLLALAVNAALGLDPAWVALTVSSGGKAARVEWSPVLVAAIEREERPLPEAEAAPLPAGMPATGTRFHLRRKVGWEIVRRAAARTAPREVALLVNAAHSVRVPLFVNGRPPDPPDRPPALARASITLPGARSAHVEITSALELAPHVDFCELGFLLSRAGFAFGRHFPMAEHQGVRPPVRIVVDSDALPTNASRSAVREDAPLFGTLQSSAAAALSDALAGVAAALFGVGTVPDGVTVDTRDPRALHDALGAFLCAAEASLVARVKLPDALRALLDLPLFQDGLGRPLAHADIPRDDPLLVWSGKDPVPVEMTPWARKIVWTRGRVAERILAARRRLDPEILAAAAKEGAARHRKTFAAPPGEVAVPDGPYLVREKLHVTEGPLAGLVGEVAIAASPSTHVRNLALRVFLEGRFYEALPVPEESVPLPCVLSLQWPGHLVPQFAYQGIEPTNGARAALAFAIRQAVFCCERFAADRPRSGQPFDASEAAVLRAALATVVTTPARMASVEGFEMPALADLPGLVHAAVWPVTEGRFVSLQDLCEHAARTSAICVAAPASRGLAPDGRPVVSALPGEVEWLSRCLRAGISMIRYDAALLPAPSAPGQKRARPDLVALATAYALASVAPVLHVEARGLAYAVTLGGAGTHVWHGSTLVSRIELDESFGGVTIAIDDDSIVPTPGWDGILYADDQAVAGRAERAYAERVVAAVLGDERARADLLRAISGPHAGRYPWPEHATGLSTALQRYLVDRAARGRAVDASAADAELSVKIERVPFLRMLSESGEIAAASLSDVVAVHRAPAPVPYLREPPRFRPIRWRPLVVADDALLEALARWSGGRIRDATSELAERGRAAAREADLAVFRARPAVDPTVVSPQGDASGPRVHLPPSPRSGACGVAAALPVEGLDLRRALVEVTFESRLVWERLLTDVSAPIVARVDLRDPACLEGFERLSARGAAICSARVREAAVELSVKVLERAQEKGAAHTFFRDLRALRLVRAVVSERDRDPRVDGALRGGLLRWPTVRGDERLFGELRLVDGQLWTGAIEYVLWAEPRGAAHTDLDRPILYVPPTPEGAELAAILEALGVKMRDVSEAIASLQAKRARGAGEKPRLAVRPPHPALACDLAEMSRGEMEGEIALHESGEAIAELTSLDGETRQVALDVTFPARAVARMEVLTSSAVAIAAQKLSRIAVRLLMSFIPSLDELPPFVRTHLRGLTCRAVSKDREVPAPARAARVFVDIDGGHWSLADLESTEHGDWSCTFDPPPYPRARQEGRTLVLTPAEHLQLHRKIQILNVTEWMRRDLEAERRREAPPIEDVRIDEAARAQLLSSFTATEGSLHGEIGLLRPAADGARGIQVLVTKRPVCRIDDGPGWPLAAVINDDTLRPSRWWNELVPADETALRARVRALATQHLRESLAAELPAEPPLASAFVDEPVPPMAAYGSTEPMTITGYVFLPARWPVTPSVRLHVQRIQDAAVTPISVATAAIQPTLPICGALLLSHAAPSVTAGAASRAGLALREIAARLLAPLVQRDATNSEISTYQWNLRLLGATSAGEPSARASDGASITADQVIDALHGREEIWLTDRQGSIEGAFPKDPPPFVLLDDGAPLVRVLRARLPSAKLRWLGSLAPRPSVVADAPPAALAAPSTSPLAAAPLDAALSHPRASRSWLGDVIGRVRDFLVNAPLPEDQATGIGAAVERTLRALRLREEPVIVVHEVTRGRLVDYDQARRVVSINVQHPALARHLAAPSQAAVRKACIALVAAAVCEVNIALEHVTDHDEEQALLELLRQEAAAGAGTSAD